MLTESEYLKLRRDLQREADRFRKAISEQEEKINLLDRFWKEIAQTRVLIDTTIKLSNGAVSLSGAVRDFVKQHEGDFTTQDVEAYVEQNYPSLKPENASSYSKPLKRMVKCGHLKLVSRASGSKRAVYRSIRPDSQNEVSDE